MEDNALKQLITKLDLLSLSSESEVMPSQLSHFLRKARKLGTASFDLEMPSAGGANTEGLTRPGAFSCCLLFLELKRILSLPIGDEKKGDRIESNFESLTATCDRLLSRSARK